MIIAQSSLDINEDSSMTASANSLAMEAYNNAEAAKRDINMSVTDKMKSFRKQAETVMNGLSTESTKTPFDVPDPNQHQDGDLWTQYTQDSRGVHNAVNMWVWQGGKWVPKSWDQQMLSVKELSALTENVGSLRGGSIYGTTISGSSIVGARMVVDIGSEDNAGDGGYNPLYWNDNGYNPNDNGSSGFHFNNGLMKFKAQRSDRNNTPDPWTWDFTFIGPNDIKIRNSRNPNTLQDGLNHRLDMRSNYIEIVDGSYNAPSTAGTNGCGLYPDGTAVISNKLYTPTIEVGSQNVNNGKLNVNSAIWCKYNVYSHGEKLTSDYSKKDHINSFDSKKALSEVLGTDIYSYHYKGDNEQTNIGPVIDDVNNITDAKYKTSNYIVSSEDGDNYIQLQNAIGLLIGSVHELSNQNEQLLGKIAKLEAKQNGNN